MSFLDGLGKFINNTVEYHNKEVERKERTMNNVQRSASDLSDRELVRYFEQSSGLNKMGYARELEDRGYLEKDENGKYVRTSKTL